MRKMQTDMSFAKSVITAAAMCMTVAVLFISGCGYVEFTGGRNSDPNQNPAIVRDMYIDKNLIVKDLPYPSGFTLDRDRSRTTATHGNIRMIDHIYIGHGEQNAAGNFYRREMPRKGWISASERSGRGLRLNFVKGKERCEVTISEISFGRLQVEISVYPENPAAAPQ